MSRLLFLCTLLVVVLLASGSAVAAPSRCTCRDGQACYHYLNAPVDPPDDPCVCPQCRAKRGSCEKKYPQDWDQTCCGNHKMECFLRRHAASWKLSCSERLAGTCACKNPHPENCPSCGINGKPWDVEGLSRIRKQVEVERRLLGPRRKFVLIESAHFYLVTDIRKLKIRTQKSEKRFMGMHEIAHLFIQRAEIARQEFIDAFGDEVIGPRPTAIYLLERESLKREVALACFGHQEPELIYGGDVKRIGGGYAYNGLAISKDKYSEYGAAPDEDHWLHLQMRHLIGHLLISCWKKVDGRNEFLPRWAYSGAGHWLSRNPENLREMANFCAGEGKVVKHSGEKWGRYLRINARNPKAHPIQRIFDVNSLGGLDLEMHIRAWSWFDLFLREDREPFIRFLAALREGKEHRAALQEAFGCSAEDLQTRWEERITGHRETIAPTAEEIDTARPEAPGARERAEIRSETDPATLAARIRALESISDPLTAATLVPLLAHESELIRETVVIALGRGTSPAVKEWLRTEGLSRSSGLARAYVARIIGGLADREAGPALTAVLSSGNWLVRAHAVRALGRIGYEPALREMARLATDRSPKVRLTAMDALARFKERAAFAWESVSEGLSNSAWQVRSAAADCLGALHDMRAVEPLIDRMEIETGRIRQDIRRALKQITRDDLGNNPKVWREWWDREVERAGGTPTRPGAGKEIPKGEHTYGEPPTYYGIRVYSRGVGYVVDTSASMIYEIELDPVWLKRHRRDYPSHARKSDLARREIEASLSSLDPRTLINVFFFRTVAMTWKSKMVPATKSNVESALRRIAGEQPTGDFGRQAFRTNYVDALRLVLDEKKGAPTSGSFKATPDTIFFLTDGKPTVGDITEPEILLSWFAERNRFARMHFNVITFGSQETNDRFLRRLAEENGGQFVQVPSAK